MAVWLDKEGRGPVLNSCQNSMTHILFLSRLNVYVRWLGKPGKADGAHGGRRDTQGSITDTEQ